MIEGRIAQFGSTSDSTSRITITTSVAEVLTGDEIKQINRDTKQEDELNEDLDDTAAEEEQDDELEEEDEVESAAEANRG